MLNIKGSKVVNSYIKRDTLVIEFDNGVTLKSNNFKTFHDFNVELFEKLSDKKITNKILGINEGVIMDIDAINCEMELDLEVKDLIGMPILVDIYENYIEIFLVVPPKYLIENSSKFSSCIDESEVTEYNENRFMICDINLEQENPELIYKTLEFILE